MLRLTQPFHRWPSILALTGSSLLIAPTRASSALQHEDEYVGSASSDRVQSESRSTETVFVGRVVDTDGKPLAQAVVVTSAGGQAVTEDDGSFRLHVQLPLSSTSVQVTAVAGSGRGSRVASAQVPTVSVGGAIPTGTLALPLTTNCQPAWLPTFGGQPGTDNTVRALAVFDDGSGPALYAGGYFTLVGAVAANRIVKWKGSSWSRLGSGMNNAVYALTVFDDGSGSALYAGGLFTSANGVAASFIAKWNGSSWSALGTGMDNSVDALTVFDDGSGPALFAGGDFTIAGSVAANRIAKWNGSTWSALGNGVNNTVYALTVFDDGGGAALYAGGFFTTAGGVAAAYIAKWNGSGWSQLGSGMSNSVDALTVFDDGSGPALYAGGYFATAGGISANAIAKWNGSGWSPLGSGMNDYESALMVFDDGSGPALYAGGGFTLAGGVAANRIARWNGSTWSALGNAMNTTVYALTVFDDGSGAALYAGGGFTTAGGVAADRIAKWNGSSWSALGNGMDKAVHAMTVFDDGSGSALYAGGSFTTAGGVAADRIAKWNGSSWSQLGSGVSGLHIFALTVFDDGSGPALYAGGSFTTAGGVAANHIAKWNGSSWSPLGSGMMMGMDSPYVSALTVFDDGSGPALYAGGLFTTAGGVAAHSIAKWNGSSWSALGSGIANYVYALTVFDDGSGSALYAGGGFNTAGGAAANYIAKWNGSYWSQLGSGMNGGVSALVVFDEGSGPALYAGGSFTTASGVTAKNIAKWNGSIWSQLGSGMVMGGNNPYVFALSVFDDGNGPALYAGGLFTAAGGVAANSIARWNGSSWSALGSGMNSNGDSLNNGVFALTVFDDGSGPALFAGGGFPVSPAGDSYLAKWGCTYSVMGTPFCFGDGTQTTPCPCANNGGTGHGCANSANAAGALLTASGTTTPDTAILFGTGMPATVGAIYLKGDQDNVTGALFGDGVRCADGNLIRLRMRQNLGGASQFPDATDPVSLSVRGGTPPGSGLTGHYQVYYRNASASFCPPATFNVSNGFKITW